MPQIDFQTPDLSYAYIAQFLLIGAASFKYVVPTKLDTEARIPYIYTGIQPQVNNKIIGYRSDYTQPMANGFQDWNRIRKCADSTGQSLLNSFAMGQGEVTDYWKDERRELFLDTADPNSIWHVARQGMPSHIDLETVTSPNLLVNSAFENSAVTRYNMPMDWTDRWNYSNTGSQVELHSADSLVGTHCVKLTAATGHRVGIWQEQDFVVPRQQKLTFSVWYKTYETQEYQYTGDSNTFMQVSLTRDDRTTSTTRKALQHGTDGSWVREYLTVTGAEDIGVVNVGVELDNTTGVRDTREYYLDAFMLERSDHPTHWRPSEVDQPESMRVMDQYFNPPFSVEVWEETGIMTGTISGYEATGSLLPKRGMGYISEYELFAGRDVPPSRLTVQSETGDLVGVNTVIWGQIANDMEEPFEKGWMLDSTTGILTYTWPFTDDTGNFYRFAEPGLNKEAIRTTLANDVYSLYHRYTTPQVDLQQTGGYEYTCSYEAMTIKDGMIWLVCEEGWTGSSNKVLKLLNPKTERTTTYLELIRDYALTGLTGVVTSVGFLESDPPQMSISMTGDNLAYSGALVNLFYDYFTFDSQTRQIYTRDLYTGSTEKLVIV